VVLGEGGRECNNLALQLDFLFVLDLPINQQATPLPTPTQLNSQRVKKG